VRLGVTAQVGVRLFSGDRLHGALNLYSTSTSVISSQVVRTADLFAVHAALALGHAQREENLLIALENRRVIGQAVGIAMERFGLDETAAFACLARSASRHQLKVRDLAAEVVAGTTTRLVPPRSRV
jgi:GAF domain-containing protein